MVEPLHAHWVAAKHVLKYLHWMISYGLRYTFDDELRLHGCIDANWAGSVIKRKSTSGCCFSFGICRDFMDEYLSLLVQSR